MPPLIDLKLYACMCWTWLRKVSTSGLDCYSQYEGLIFCAHWLYCERLPFRAVKFICSLFLCAPLWTSKQFRRGLVLWRRNSIGSNCRRSQWESAGTVACWADIVHPSSYSSPCIPDPYFTRQLGQSLLHSHWLRACPNFN
jgi:hypothetical protein